jgi:nicotinamide-nucleotide amidase
MHRRVSLLVTGSEILDGRVVDTNSNYIAAALSREGVELVKIISCDDSESAIMESISFLLARSEIVVISGGLGPTTDDLTREAVASYAGVELKTDQTVLEKLVESYRKRGRQLDASNHKQADFPEGATIIDNPNGTAPGFITRVKRQGAPAKHIAALPGVPFEMKPMFDETVLPYILWEFGSSRRLNRRVLRTCGIPEADLNTRIGSLRLDPEIIVSYRASFPEIQLILKTSGSEETLESEARRVRAELGDEHIFSESLEQGYAETLLAKLSASAKTLAITDYGSGGFFTRHLGSKEFPELFLGMNVYRTLPEKFRSLAAQDPEMLARELAQLARTQFSSDIGLGLVAPVPAASSEATTSDFFVALSTASGDSSRKFLYNYSPRLFRSAVSFRALEFLRQSLG